MRDEAHEVQRPVDETRDAEEDAGDKVKGVRAHIAVTRYRRHSRAVGYCSALSEATEDADRQTGVSHNNASTRKRRTYTSLQWSW